MTNTNKVVKVAKTRKIDVKKAAKIDISEMFVEFLEAKGIEVDTNYADYAFTQGTVVVHMDNTDVQVKFITPKHGITRYPQVVYVDEEEYEEMEENGEISQENVEELEEKEIEDAKLEAELVE